MAITTGPPSKSFAPASAYPPGATTPPGSATRAYEAEVQAAQERQRKQQAETVTAPVRTAKATAMTPEAEAAVVVRAPGAYGKSDYAPGTRVFKSTAIDKMGNPLKGVHDAVYYTESPPVNWNGSAIWDNRWWQDVAVEDIPEGTPIRPRDISTAYMQGYLFDKAQAQAAQTTLAGLAKYSSDGGRTFDLVKALKDNVPESVIYSAGFKQADIDRANAAISGATATPTVTVTTTGQSALLSLAAWEAKAKEGGLSGDLSGMYKEYVKANETVGISQLGTITEDALSRFPGAKVGDKYAVTESGQEVLVGPDIKATDKLYKLGAEQGAQSLQAARASQESYDKWAAQFTSQELAEIQSGKYLAYSPDTKTFVPTTKALVEAREAAGYTPQELDEIYSGKYKITPVGASTTVPVTRAQYDEYTARQTALQALTPYSSVPTPEQFASGRVPPTTYDIVSFLQANLDKSTGTVRPDAVRVLSDANFDAAATAPLIKAVEDITAAGAWTANNKIDLTKAPDSALRALGVAKPIAIAETGNKEEKRWVNVRTGETYTNAERASLLSEHPAAQDELVLTPTAVRGAITGAATYIENVPPIAMKNLETLSNSMIPWGLPRIAVTGALGFGSALASIPFGLVSLGLKSIASPGDIPGLATNVFTGSVDQIKATALNLAIGKYGADLAQSNLFPLAYDSTMSWLIVAGAGKTAKGVVSRVTTFIVPKGVPTGTIIKEVSTGRIPISQEEFAKNYADALNTVEKLATSKGGKFTGEVPIEGTQYKLRYLKTPIQQIVGNVLFHGTKDEIGPGGVVAKPSLLRVAEEGEGTASVSAATYASLTAFDKMKALADKIPQDVARVDTTAVRKLNLADATDVPKQFVPIITNYIQSNSGKIYGSFVEWIKLKNANQPHDIDVVFRTNNQANNARSYFLDVAQKAGYEARANDRGVQIKSGNNWVTFINIVSDSQHASMLKGIFKPAEGIVDGIRVGTLGSQAVMQRLGSLVGDAKAATREARLKKISDAVVKVAEDKQLSAKLTEELNSLIVGEGGLYASPWAAIGYTRGGKNPGVLMIVTDASKLKSGAKGLAEGLTQSDKFIRGADKGFYGPSKTWEGDLETEVVGSPGTKITIPKPTGNLATRLLVGSYADFFTVDKGEFVPIKIGLDAKSFDPVTLAALKRPSTWYAVKLQALYGSLRDTAEAVKHPSLMLKDVGGTLKELARIDRLGDIGGGDSLTFPGMRDVYLIRNWGSSISDIAQNLWDAAFKKTRADLGRKVSVNSDTFSRAMERNLANVYRANANAIINQFGTVSKAYAASKAVRNKFESTYVANVGLSTEAAVKSYSLAPSIVSTVVNDIVATAPPKIAIATQAAHDKAAMSVASETAQVKQLRSTAPSTVPAVAVTPTSELPSRTMGSGNGISEARTTESAPATASEAIPPESRVAKTALSSETSRATETRTPETRTEPRTLEVRTPLTTASRVSTSETPRTPRTIETPRTPETRRPETPITLETPRTTGTPRTPETLRTPRTPESRTLSETPETPKPIIVSSDEAAATGVEVAPGTLAWRQGVMYRWIPPPWTQRKPKASRRPPIGFVDKGRTPRETLQIIGAPNSKVPKSVSIDLGFEDIFIENYGRTIRFKGGGLETIAGESIQSPTVGMSVPATTPRKVRAKPRYSVSKKISKAAKPKRGVRYMGGEMISLSELTGL